MPQSEAREEWQALTPRSELSGITDNNISENDYVVSEAASTAKKDAESQAFLEEHDLQHIILVPLLLLRLQIASLLIQPSVVRQFVRVFFEDTGLPIRHMNLGLSSDP